MFGEEHVRYLHGQCHLMAIALHRLSGLPIYAWLTEDDILGTCLAHAFVSPDEGVHAVDVKGLRTAEDALAEFSDDPAWLEQLTEADVLELGAGSSAVTEELDRTLHEAAAFAGRVLPIYEAQWRLERDTPDQQGRGDVDADGQAFDFGENREPTGVDVPACG